MAFLGIKYKIYVTHAELLLERRQQKYWRHPRKPRKACAKFLKKARVWAVGRPGQGFPGMGTKS